MSPSLKASLALIFVAAMGAILIRPIVNAVDAPVVAEPDDTPAPARSKRAKVSPTPRPSPSPEPSPSSEGGLISGPFRTQPLESPYPARCLNRSAAPQLPGLIAAVADGRVAIGYPDGRVIDSAPLLRVVGFDYSERGLAGVRAKGGFVDGLLSRTPRRHPDYIAWAFTPMTNCALRLRSDGALWVEPNRGKPVILARDVRTFAIAPDGQRIALVLEEDATTSVWLADLDGTSLQEVQRVRTGPRVSLKAWSPNGRTLYMTFGPDSGLSFVTVTDSSAPPLSGGVVAVPVTSLEQCGDRLLGVVNGAIATITTRGPDYLTDTNAGYTAVSCAPNGSFRAALRDDDLFLLDAEGRELRDLTLDPGFRDVYVDWGERGAGVLLGRVPTGGGAGQVWHIAEGGAARNTGLAFTPGPGAIDWSASPPTGLPLP